ncbi:MAG: VanZ family protein [Bacteroidota bacterium]
MLKYLFRYKFSILLAGFIALLSLLPSSSMPDSSLFSISYLDKIVHFSMYGFFGFVSLLETRCKERCLRLHMLLLIIIFIMSTTLEVLQATVVASRSAEWLDLLANLSGLVAGYFAYRILFKFVHNFRS